MQKPLPAHRRQSVTPAQSESALHGGPWVLSAQTSATGASSSVGRASQLAPSSHALIVTPLEHDLHASVSAISMGVVGTRVVGSAAQAVQTSERLRDAAWRGGAGRGGWWCVVSGAWVVGRGRGRWMGGGSCDGGAVRCGVASHVETPAPFDAHPDHPDHPPTPAHSHTH